MLQALTILCLNSSKSDNLNEFWHNINEQLLKIDVDA